MSGNNLGQNNGLNTPNSERRNRNISNGFWLRHQDLFDSPNISEQSSPGQETQWSPPNPYDSPSVGPSVIRQRTGDNSFIPTQTQTFIPRTPTRRIPLTPINLFDASPAQSPALRDNQFADMPDFALPPAAVPRGAQQEPEPLRQIPQLRPRTLIPRQLVYDSPESESASTISDHSSNMWLDVPDENDFLGHGQDMEDYNSNTNSELSTNSFYQRQRENNLRSALRPGPLDLNGPGTPLVGQSLFSNTVHRTPVRGDDDFEEYIAPPTPQILMQPYDDDDDIMPLQIITEDLPISKTGDNYADMLFDVNIKQKLDEESQGNAEGDTIIFMLGNASFISSRSLINNLINNTEYLIYECFNVQPRTELYPIINTHNGTDNVDRNIEYFALKKIGILADYVDARLLFTAIRSFEHNIFRLTRTNRQFNSVVSVNTIRQMEQGGWPSLVSKAHCQAGQEGTLYDIQAVTPNWINSTLGGKKQQHHKRQHTKKRRYNRKTRKNKHKHRHYKSIKSKRHYKH